MRAVLVVVLLTACGAAPVGPGATAVRDEIELSVSRWQSTDSRTYRIVSSRGVDECVEHALLPEVWGCTAWVPRGEELRISAPDLPEWRVSVAGDALSVDVLVEQSAADRPVRRVWIEVATNRELPGVTLDFPARRLVNGSALSLVPGGFEVLPTTHLESLGASGWEWVPTHGSVCGTVPDEPTPILPGADGYLDGARMGSRWLAAEPPSGPFRVASYVAVVVAPGRPYVDVEPRITERYTVWAPLDRLEDYAGVLAGE